VLDDQSLAAQFPTLSAMTYLNTAAEGIPPLVVGQALQEYFHDHQRGMAGRDAHFAKHLLLRQRAAKLLRVETDDVAICSCTSEAMNLVRMALRLKEGDEVIINDLEFPSSVTPWLPPNSPATIKLWKARDGALRLDDLIPLLSPRTRFIAFSWVSFYNGYRQHLNPIVEAVRKHSPALVAVDVTQGIGRVPLEDAPVDLFVSSTHKWLVSTHGGGIVAIPKASRDRWTVPAGGWFNIANAFDADRFQHAVVKVGAAGFSVGMPNFPAIYAIAAGTGYIADIGVETIDQATRPLVQLAHAELRKLPLEVITPDDPSTLSGIIAFRHPAAEKINQHLVKNNVHLMCQAGRMRISIHGYNRPKDIQNLITHLREALNHV
jgi:selenocysteine lyase/cysteine desulfurase